MDKAAEADGFPHSSADDYKFDPVKNLWEGWMYVGRIPDDTKDL